MIVPIRARASGESPHLKIGVAGASGAGKTTLGARSCMTDPHKVVAVIAEGQAQAIFRLWNPDALVIHVRTYQEVQEAWELLYRGFQTGKMPIISTGTDPIGGGSSKTLFGPGTEPFDFETVVLDSFSDVFRMVKAEITARSYRRGLAKFQASNPGKAYEEPEVTTMQDWGIVQEKCIALLRAFRDLPAHFLALFGLDEREEGGSTVYRPYMQGRDLKAACLGFFNGFGYMCRVPYIDDGGQTKVRRQVHFLTDETYATKPLDGLDAVEAPDFRSWVVKFREHCERRADARAKAAQAASAPSESTVVALPSKPTGTHGSAALAEALAEVTVKAIVDRLRGLPDSAKADFCATLGVRRIRDIRADQEAFALKTLALIESQCTTFTLTGKPPSTSVNPSLPE